MERRMTSVEIQAVSVQEAVRLALEQLELSEDQVDIEILSDAGPDEDDEALVRVTAKGMASQPTPRPNRRGPGGRERRVPGDRPSSRGVPPVRGSRPLGGTSRRLRESVVPAPRADEESERIAKQVTRELLEHMGIEAEVIAVDNPSMVPVGADDPPTIFLDILGPDLGLLIGRRGDNLAQLQYLITLLVNRHLDEYTRVIIDVEGYRLRREEALVSLAERVARQVARSRRPVTLEPMPANERRIIHMALRSNPDVTTESSGEGNARRVTVQPRV